MLLSPLSVIYSQEIRVYALLPVVYLALLLLAGRWLAHPRRAEPSASEDADSALPVCRRQNLRQERTWRGVK